MPAINASHFRYLLIAIIAVILSLMPYAFPSLARAQLLNIQTIDKFVQGLDIGDVDNDGQKELVISAPLEKKVHIYDTGFNLKYSIDFPEAPRAILIADLDGDGQNELVVAAAGTQIPCPNTNPMTPACRIGWSIDNQSRHVYIGKVTTVGAWTVAWTSPPLYVRFPTELAAADLNGNGKKELIIGLSYYDRKLVAYEHNGTTFQQIFVDNIGSDTDSVYVTGNKLLVGTNCYSDYGLRVYDNYSLVFSDLGDGTTHVTAGDVNGDGKTEIVRGVAGFCGGAGGPPKFMVYNDQNQLTYTSPLLKQEAVARLWVATGDLLPGGGDEIAVGTETWDGSTTHEFFSIFQFTGSTYEETWRATFPTLDEDVYYLKIADLNGDGVNELYVSSTYALRVYARNTGNSPPVADAGPDKTVNEETLVTLDATGSRDLDDDALTLSWTQLAGDPVTLDTTDPYHPKFTAPSVPAGGMTLTFQLIVNDGQINSPPDTVDVKIINVDPPPIAYTWYTYGGYEYALTQNYNNWSGAEAEAVAQGGHLVTITDQNQVNFLINTFQNTYVRDYPEANLSLFWIGLHNTSGNLSDFSAWQWISGDSNTFWQSIRFSLWGWVFPDQAPPPDCSPVSGCGNSPVAYLHTRPHPYPGTINNDIRWETRAAALGVIQREASSPGGDYYFRDDFIGSISSNWQITNPDPTKYSLTSEELIISTTNTDTWGGSNNLTNLFTIPIPANLDNITVTAKLRFPTTPYQNWQQGGIIIMAGNPGVPDMNNYYRLEYGYLFGQLRVETVRESNGSPGDILYPIPSLSGGVIWLRIEGSGNQYRASYSIDGVDFVVFDTMSFPWIPTNIGIHALNGWPNGAASLPIHFDYFEAYSGTPPATNHPPILNSIGNKNVNEGQLLQFTVAATDPDNNALTYSVNYLPSGASFNPATGAFSWTPGYDQAGTYSNIVFTVIDNGTPPLIASKTITITVGNLNRQPLASAGLNRTVPVGTSVILDGSGSYDPDGNTPLSFAWTFVAQPVGSGAILLNPASGSPSFVPDVPGAYEIQLVVTNSLGASSNPARVTITATGGLGPIDASISHNTNVWLPGRDAVPFDETLQGSREWIINMWNHAGEWNDPRYPFFTFTNPVITIPGTLSAWTAGSLPPGFPGLDVRLNKPYNFQPGFDSSREVSPLIIPAGATVIQEVTVKVTLRDHTLYEISNATAVNNNAVEVTIGPSNNSVNISEWGLEMDREYTLTGNITVTNSGDTPIASKPVVRVSARNFHTPSVIIGSSTFIDDNSLAIALENPNANRGVFLVDSPAEWHPRIPDESNSITYSASSEPAPNTPPVANAGPDQTVDEGASVTLDATGSRDPDRDTLALSWTQLAGETVSLDTTDPYHPTFVAPSVSAGGTTLTFQLIVNDGLTDSPPDTVNVTVKNVNHPPVADPGDTQTLKEGILVILNGEASYDLDGEALTYTWTQIAGLPVTLSNPNASKPAFTAPEVGRDKVILTFSLVVNDGIANSLAKETTVTVENFNHPAVANAGQDKTINEGGLVQLDGTASTDPDRDPIAYSWSQISGPTVTLNGPATSTPSFTAPLVGSGGAKLVFQLAAADDLGAGTTDIVEVNVLSINDPPNCNLGKPSIATIWPPDHKMVNVNIIGITDPNAGDQFTITVTGVTQDEPINGLGDGDTSPDAVIQGGNQTLLRAERAGIGNGRVYWVNFTAMDRVGESCSGAVTVCVPHDRKDTCMDDGQYYNSTQP